MLACGANGNGWLGDGSTTNRLTPTPVLLLSSVTTIAASNTGGSSFFYTVPSGGAFKDQTNYTACITAPASCTVLYAPSFLCLRMRIAYHVRVR